jgi:hypothetical protein
MLTSFFVEAHCGQHGLLHMRPAASLLVTPRNLEPLPDMYLNPAKFIEGMFMAAAGIGLMLGLPMFASKFEGGLPLLAIAVAAALFYLYDQGYIWF